MSDDEVAIVGGGNGGGGDDEGGSGRRKGRVANRNRSTKKTAGAKRQAGDKKGHGGDEEVIEFDELAAVVDEATDEQVVDEWASKDDFPLMLNASGIWVLKPGMSDPDDCASVLNHPDMMSMVHQHIDLLAMGKC